MLPQFDGQKPSRSNTSRCCTPRQDGAGLLPMVLASTVFFGMFAFCKLTKAQKFRSVFI